MADYPNQGGGGGAPSGPAGGVLSGTYPDPDFAVDMATQAELGAHAALTTGAHNLATLLGAKADLVGGLVPTAQIPAIAITDVLPVASQAAMLALTAQRGDVAIRSDTNQTFILSTDSPGTLADWKLLPTPADAVLSVNGQAGVVVLAKADVGLSLVDNTSDANKPLAGDSTGTLGAVVNAKIRGKNVPTPGAPEDQKTWVYDHATSAMVWTPLPAGGTPKGAQTEPMAVGEWLMQPTGGLNAFTFANGQARFSALWLPDGIGLDGLACEVAVAASAGGKVRIIVYNANADGSPNLLVLDSGQIDATSAAVKVVTGLSSGAISSPAGLYWATAVNQGAPATVASLRYSSIHYGQQFVQPAGTPSGFTAFRCSGWNATIAGAPPSPASGFTRCPPDGSSDSPRIAVRRGT